MALVTLAEYKRAIKVTTAADDTFHQEALDAASDAVLNYSDRDFGAPNVTETRTYLYDGSGVLQIDDAASVTSVAIAGAAPLGSTAWRARTEGPGSVVAFSWLELPLIDLRRRTGSAGAMGFEQNLDVYLAQGGSLPELSATVTANWGWPTVPSDVKRAVIWTAEAFEAISPSTGGAGGVASRSVAEVAESYFSEIQSQQTPAAEALPPRAQAIIDAYRRVSIH